MEREMIVNMLNVLKTEECKRRLYSPKTHSQLLKHILPKQNSEYTRAQLSGNKLVMRNRNKNANHYVESTFPWQNLSELSLTWRWRNEKNIFVEHLYARHLLRHKASAKERHVFLPAQRRMFFSVQLSFKCKRMRRREKKKSRAARLPLLCIRTETQELKCTISMKAKHSIWQVKDFSKGSSCSGLWSLFSCLIISTSKRDKTWMFQSQGFSN